MRRALRIAGWTLLGLIGLPLLVLVAVLATANTDSGRRLIENSTARLTNGIVQLQGLSGSLPERLRVRQLTISDQAGPWLQVQDIVLDWSSLRLWADELDVQKLTVQRVIVARRPQYPAGRPHAAMNWASWSLPLTIQVGTLSLPHIELAASLAGRQVEVQLQGSGRFRSLQRAALRLTAMRLDRLPASYQLTANLSRRRVSLALDVAEQASGPLANVIELPGLGALAVHLRLDGPSDALGVQLAAQAGALRANIHGSVDLPDRAGTLDVDVHSPAMSPRPGLSWQQVLLQAHVRGPFTAPASIAQLNLAGLTAGSVQLAGVQVTLQGQGQGMALNAALAGVSLPAPLGNLLRSAPVKLQAQARVDGRQGVTLQVSLTHPLLSAQAQYALAMRLGPRATGENASSRAATLAPNTGTVSASFADLAPWTALAGLSLRGRATAQGRLDLQEKTRRLSIDAVLNVAGGQAPLADLLTSRAALSASLGFDQKGIQLERAQLTSPALSASARGSLQQGRLALTWQGQILKLAAVVPAASGQASVQGHLEGAIPRLSLEAMVDTRFTVHQASGALHLRLIGSDLPQRPSGQVQANGSLDGSPLALQAALGTAGNGGLSLHIQQAHWRSAQVQGVVTMVRGSIAPVGQLTVRVDQLADLSTLAGEPLQGSLTGQVNLQRIDGHSRAQLQLQAQGVSLHVAQVSTAQVQGTVDLLQNGPQLALQLSAQGNIKGAAATLVASASGMLSDLQLRATVSATAPDSDAATASATTGSPLAAAGSAPVRQAGPLGQLIVAGDWNTARSRLRLTSLSASYRGQNARLRGPAFLSFRDGFSVQQLRLQVAAADVEIDGEVTPRLELRASARNLAPAAVAVMVPALREWRPQGVAQADIELHGSLEQPSGTVTFAATGLGSGSAAVRGLPTASVKVSIQLAAGVAELHAAIDSGTSSSMRFNLDGRVPLQAQQPMSLHMTGNLDLNFANPVLEAGGQRVLGVMRVEGQVSGTRVMPMARGQLTLVNASFQDYARGVQLSNINATLEADGSQLRLTRLDAQAGHGTLSATGTVDLSRNLPAHITLNAHNAEALKSDLITAELDMALQLTGPLEPRNLELGGTLRVNRATINIPNGLPPDLPVLHVVRPGEQLQPTAPQVPLIAKLDLTVNAPTGIFVRGRGLNTEVGGQLRISGSSTSPRVAGGFDLINGTVDMAGSTLNFSSGRLSFNGNGLHNKIDPTLDFNATTYSGGITATLNVGGYADAPVITLTSNPPLPQDEILARLLFGESVAQLTPLQVAGIGAALVSMSGVGGAGGFNPLTSVQHALGLNRLVISSGTPTTAASTAPTGATPAPTTSGATIEAGRYVSNRVYVGAKQSTSGLTQAQVQVDLTRNWKLQTTLSTGGGTVQGATPENDPGSSVGMSYQFEY